MKDYTHIIEEIMNTREEYRQNLEKLYFYANSETPQNYIELERKLNEKEIKLRKKLPANHPLTLPKDICHANSDSSCLECTAYIKPNPLRKRFEPSYKICLPTDEGATKCEYAPRKTKEIKCNPLQKLLQESQERLESTLQPQESDVMRTGD